MSEKYTPEIVEKITMDSIGFIMKELVSASSQKKTGSGDQVLIYSNIIAMLLSYLMGIYKHEGHDFNVDEFLSKVKEHAEMLEANTKMIPIKEGELVN